MRRELETNRGNYIDWLKSIGCVFYCEFDGLTGTRDLITGTELTLTGYGSCTYDQTHDAYNITSPSSNNSVGFWRNGVRKSDFNNKFSAIAIVQRISSSGKMPKISLIGDGEWTLATSCMYNVTNECSNFPSSVVKIGHSFNESENTRKYYQNGELFGSYASYSPYCPSNWNPSEAGFQIGKPIGYNYQYVSMRFFRYGIFNTELDAQTIYDVLNL